MPLWSKSRYMRLSGGHTLKFLQKNYSSLFGRLLKLHSEHGIQNALRPPSARSHESFEGVGVKHTPMVKKSPYEALRRSYVNVSLKELYQPFAAGSVRKIFLYKILYNYIT